MKRLNILYYAVLREQRGQSEESVETEAVTAAELYREVALRHRFTLDRDRLRVVINESFAPWDSTLEDGDTVVFIPPVAGG